MRRRYGVALAGAVVALSVAGWWLARPAPPDWSTKDPEALKAFLAGREALERIYTVEAIDDLRRALARDPDFVAARLLLASAVRSTGREQEAKAELARALASDPAKLTPRERRLRELSLPSEPGKPDRKRELLEKWAAEYPDDPEVTRQLGQMALNRRDLDGAVRWCEATLKLVPNDAMSYNTLGYVEMARGNFTAAEANLKRYAFIAPDQANPHDSLGELYTLTGRWDEAERELNRAIEVNPRFYVAWGHLARVAALRGDAATAAEYDRRSLAIMGADEKAVKDSVAVVEAWAALSRGDIAAMRDILGGLPAGEVDPEADLLRGVVALGSRDVGATTAIEHRVEREAAEKKMGWGAGTYLELIRALRLSAEGDNAKAADLLGALDGELIYSGDQGILKLTVKCFRVGALARAGRVGQARQLLAEVENVNSRFPGVKACRNEVEGR